MGYATQKHPSLSPQLSGQFPSGTTSWLFHTSKAPYDQKTRSHWYFMTADSKTFSWAVYLYQQYHSISVFHYRLFPVTRITLLVYSLVYMLLECQYYVALISYSSLFWTFKGITEVTKIHVCPVLSLSWNSSPQIFDSSEDQKLAQVLLQNITAILWSTVF